MQIEMHKNSSFSLKPATKLAGEGHIHIKESSK